MFVINTANDSNICILLTKFTESCHFLNEPTFKNSLNIFQRYLDQECKNVRNMSVML